METYQGTVGRIIYTNTKNTYCVFLFQEARGMSFVCIANTAAPHVGDIIEVHGAYKTHSKYGKQFAVASFSRVKPETVLGARYYLTQLHIAGLGEKSLERILDHFGADIVTVLASNDPVEILDVPKVRQSVKEELYRTLVGEGALSHLDAFLTEHGLSTKWSQELFERYGEGALDLVTENPYILLRLPTPAPFSEVDKVAMSLGFAINDPQRMDAAVYYIMDNLSNRGHTCLPFDEMLASMDELFTDYIDEVALHIQEMANSGLLIMTEWDGILYVYPPNLYDAEVQSVDITRGFVQEDRCSTLDWDSFISDFEEKEAVTLGQEQKDAIMMALQNRMATITGGPGTGKTTIIKALVQAFLKEGMERIVLCAPTGRAAKRLAEATNFDATTIHRLLIPVPGSDAYDFEKNAEDQIDAEVVIVDEASMINVELYHALVAATPETASFIVVGDVNQLPPIGAGFVLRDLLQSGVVPFTQLQTIYRQQEGNLIIDNAYKINQGDMPTLSDSAEFTFISVRQSEELMETLVRVYAEELATTKDELDLQIICPMRRNDTGSVRISQIIQERVHGKLREDTKVPSVKINGQFFYLGDKVIQMVNDYELNLMNGEIGTIYSLTKESAGIRFIDKEVTIPTERLDQMMLAYAITVHKAQGSEYDTVILPFISAYGRMLQRNLLYTAITRAKKKVIVVGSQDAIQKALQSVDGQERSTLFTERLIGDMDV